MMSKIGTSDRGFTLIEVMLAAMALSLGALLIYQSFFMTLDAHNYCRSYFTIASWSDEKMWQAQEEVTRFGAIVDIDSMGQLTKDGKVFRWALSCYPVDEESGLYSVDMMTVWQDGRRASKILRNGYAIYDMP